MNVAKIVATSVICVSIASGAAASQPSAETSYLSAILKEADELMQLAAERVDAARKYVLEMAAQPSRHPQKPLADGKQK